MRIGFDFDNTIKIDKSVTLLNNSGGDVIFDGGGDGQNNGPTGVQLFHLNSNDEDSDYNFTFNGFTFTGGEAQGGGDGGAV